MGLARTIAVSVPLLLTVISLIGLLLAFTGNVSSSSVAQHFYFLGITTTAQDDSHFTQTIGMWNSCLRASSAETICNATKAAYFFNPVTEFDLAQEDLDLLEVQWPSAFAQVTDMFEKMTRWAFALYVLSIVLTVVTLPVSFFAYRHRIGSVATSLINVLAGLCIIAASALYTVVFASLQNFIKEAVADVSPADADVTVTPHLNANALAATWLAAATTTIAFSFWAVTACFCTGVRYHNKESYNLVERQPHIIASHEVHGYPQDFVDTSKESIVGEEGRAVQSGRYEPYRS